MGDRETTNLLQETVAELKRNGKDSSHVVWVGHRDGSMAITWAEFEKIADIDYDAGFGSERVANNLVIVGRNWWLERHEYDGSEWWEFKIKPERKRKSRPFTVVVNFNYNTHLEEMQPND